MVAYEKLIIFKPDLGQEIVDKILEKINNIITTDGGEVSTVEKWGTRKLAYPIKKCDQGFFVHILFKSKPGTIASLIQNNKVIDSIIRYLITKMPKKSKREKKVEQEAINKEKTINKEKQHG